MYTHTVITYLPIFFLNHRIYIFLSHALRLCLNSLLFISSKRNFLDNFLCVTLFSSRFYCSQGKSGEWLLTKARGCYRVNAHPPPPLSFYKLVYTPLLVVMPRDILTRSEERERASKSSIKSVSCFVCTVFLRASDAGGDNSGNRDCIQLFQEMLG